VTGRGPLLLKSIVRLAFDLQPFAGLGGITSQSHAAYHAYSAEDVQRPKLHRLHTALELPDGQLATVSAYRADYDEKHAEREARWGGNVSVPEARPENK
jgi:hypothetical protein